MSILTRANFETAISDRSQEMALATKTSAEVIRYLDLATQDIRNRHQFREVRETTNLSFTRSTTLPFATVSIPADFWHPSYLNNANEDYYFWWAEPDTIRQIVRGGRYSYDDIENIFARDGSDLMIYHDTTETLVLKYYSRNLVMDTDGTTDKQTWAAATDTFRIENDDLLITRVLMYLAQKEPKTIDQYNLLKTEFLEHLENEKSRNPSQVPLRLEPLVFVG